MKAHLHAVRIAPKKANIIAKMVRGMPALQAAEALRRTHKKAARMVEKLILSAVANAEHNDKQSPEHLVIKSIVVNQGAGYPRGVPMARGRVRPMIKFMSHITVTLGVKTDETAQRGKKEEIVWDEPKRKASPKNAKSASQKAKTPVQKKQTSTRKAASSSTSSATSPVSSTPKS